MLALSDTSPAEGNLLRTHVQRELKRQAARPMARRPGWVWIWVGAGLLWASLVLWLAG